MAAHVNMKRSLEAGSHTDADAKRILLECSEGVADPVQSVLGNSDFLSKILDYAASDVKDTPSICATCRQWNDTINKDGKSSRALWRRLCKKKHPELDRLYDLCKESKCTDGQVGWKLLLCRRMASAIKPIGLNQSLQRDFEIVFQPEGILGFTCCCSNFTANYGDDLRYREKGITFFKLFLDGMNYDFDGYASSAPICYSDWQYLMDNWQSECDIIRRWCAILGLDEGDYDVEKPKSQKTCIMVNFKKMVRLEVPDFDEEDY